MGVGERRSAARSAGLLLLGVILLAGCTDNGSVPTAPAGSAFRLTPGNEATGVKLDASVTLSFDTAVDHATVEGGMHLIAEPRMYDPDPSMSHPGSMDDVMMDPAMMNYMDTYHSTSGHFAWNSGSTICTFHPDSLMLPQTRYMVHLRGSMVHMMPGMGGMMDVYTNSGGDVMTHFHTVGVGP
jgi:hypothetical protein